MFQFHLFLEKRIKKETKLVSKFPETLLEKLVYSLKLESWPKVIVPYIFSLALVWNTFHSLPISGVILGFFYILFLVAYIVHFNDYADSEVDRIKRAMFPEHCSPKTIPDGILTEHQVLGAGLVSLSMILVIGIVSYIFFDAHSLSGILLSIGVFWMYSLRPFRLNYRGGGELLEAIGISFIIPMTIFQIFGYSLSKEHFVLILPSFLLSISSAIASGLTDESSDRIGGKRTVVTMIGSKKAALVLSSLFTLGIGMFSGVLFAQKELLFSITASFFAIVGIFIAVKLFQIAMTIQTNSFFEIRLLKSLLHKGIWFSILIISLVLCINTIF